MCNVGEPKVHNSARAKQNWNNLRSCLLKELFLSKFLENARNEKGGDDESDIDNSDEKYCYSDILVAPTSRKRICYEYFIAVIAITTMIFNTYALFVDLNVSMVYNFVVIPFFCIEIYLSSVSTFYEDIFLVK